MHEQITANTHELTDEELRHLRLFLTMGARAELLPVRERLVLADLAASVGGALSGRVLAWHDILCDPAVPPDWDTAVRALEDVE